MKTRIDTSLLMPPSKGISYMFRVGAEITIKIITKLRLGRGNKRRQVIKDIVGRRRRLSEEFSNMVANIIDNLLRSYE
jgi:hypothetical protein